LRKLAVTTMVVEVGREEGRSSDPVWLD
jgi:hypothetical protein